MGFPGNYRFDKNSMWGIQLPGLPVEDREYIQHDPLLRFKDLPSEVDTLIEEHGVSEQTLVSGHGGAQSNE